ncbi:GNAT family N-acetyltransferase [Agrococcus jejuensis]|uniref:Diamine N-acetyltransferase n=1 Tax=Agrococcus jejuensis TaxID=399736 RepID=A0A1G8AW46_9MICO|nr:GNAT family N-acetyltransferase [Agrococcus jejuensis]SDH25262.1 diamine N-acetyltransferase [Agrococcus jejuensis]
MTLRLAELTPDTLGAAVRLPPAVGEPANVAPVVFSIAEAYVTPSAWPRVVLDGDEVVGFVMASWDPENELEAFRAGVWRLDVAESAQGRGVGRFAVEQVAEEARRRGIERITVLWEPGDDGPEGFYLRLGFVQTGEILFGEVVGALDL